MSGALYESILVVEINSIGAEILCRIVPVAKERFVVRCLFGTSGLASEVLALRLVVKALARDTLLNVRNPDKGRMGVSFPSTVGWGQPGCSSVRRHWIGADDQEYLHEYLRTLRSLRQLRLEGVVEWMIVCASD